MSIASFLRAKFALLLLPLAGCAGLSIDAVPPPPDGPPRPVSPECKSLPNLQICTVDVALDASNKLVVLRKDLYIKKTTNPTIVVWRLAKDFDYEASGVVPGKFIKGLHAIFTPQGFFEDANGQIPGTRRSRFFRLRIDGTGEDFEREYMLKAVDAQQNVIDVDPTIANGGH